MTLKEISFDLPPELIAQNPSAIRGDDRLLVYHTKKNAVEHQRFENLPGILEPGTVCVINNSKVRKARILVKDDKNREWAILLNNPDQNGNWSFLIPRMARRKEGQEFSLPDGGKLTLVRREGELWWGKFSTELSEDYFQHYGHVPLPPYIHRADGSLDEERYQTIFAHAPGSSAAPTAGLHFSENIVAKLQEKNIQIASITLHVGLGTFLPIHAQNILDHHMHTEEFEISEESALLINSAIKEKRPLLAVGTTSLRTLESAWTPELYQPGKGRTDIFITPGYRFKSTEFLLTNFHTPGSTLLLLVGALAGLENVLEVYQKAVEKQYRFFSYGDAMLFDPF